MAKPQKTLDAIDNLLAGEPWRVANGGVWRAQELVEDGLRTAPEDAELLSRAGCVHVALHEWSRAETYFVRALRAHADDWRTHNNMGVALLRQDRSEEALTSFLAASDKCEDSSFDVCLATNVAVALRSSGNIHAAQAVREHAFALADTGLPDHLFRLSWLEAHFRAHLKSIHLLWRYAEAFEKRLTELPPLLPNVEELRERLDTVAFCEEHIESLTFVATLRSTLGNDQSRDSRETTREVLHDLGWLTGSDIAAG